MNIYIFFSITDVFLQHTIQYYFHYHGKQEILFQLLTFKVKYREKMKKRELCTFKLHLICGHYVCFRMYICSKPQYICFAGTYSFYFYLWPPIFMPFVPPCDVCEDIVYISTCASSFAHLSASVSLTSVNFTFTEKSDSDTINHVLSVLVQSQSNY